MEFFVCSTGWNITEFEIRVPQQLSGLVLCFTEQFDPRLTFQIC